MEPGSSNSPANPGFCFRAGLLFFGGVFMLAFMYCSTYLPQIHAHKQQNAVGQVPDDRADRLRELPDHRGHGQDLIVGGQPRVFQQIHDLDPVVAGQVLLADTPQVLDRQ